MIRTIKTVGLAVVAVLAMSAFLASAASAASFTASSYPASGTGEQTVKNSFTVQGSTIECTTAHFAGELGAASSDITITPKYEGCTTSIGSAATVHMNSCKFTFTAETSTTGSVHVVCANAGDSITVTIGSLCTIHIPAQTPTTNKIDYKNEAGGVLVTSTAAGIHSSVTRTNPFLCPLSSAETDTSGVYAGSVLFKGLGGKTVSVS